MQMSRFVLCACVWARVPSFCLSASSTRVMEWMLGWMIYVRVAFIFGMFRPCVMLIMCSANYYIHIYIDILTINIVKCLSLSISLDAS